MKPQIASLCSDGSDGDHGSGGEGNGWNISLYSDTFTTWSLAPGAGGQHEGDCADCGGGGGGGGVSWKYS